MFGIGMTELVVIFVVALVLFGPTKLPELARSLGRAMAEFRRASTDLRQTLREAVDEPRLAPPREAPEKPAAEPSRAAAAEAAETASPNG
jgi:TatA/E family protein of Tat protein translocase